MASSKTKVPVNNTTITSVIEVQKTLDEKLNTPRTFEETVRSFRTAVDFLLTHRSIYGHLLVRMPVNFIGSDTKSNEKFSGLRLNWSYKMANVSTAARAMVLEHEILHVLNGHLQLPHLVRQTYGDARLGYAADAVVNDETTMDPAELKDSRITPESLGLPKALTVLQYAELMKDWPIVDPPAGNNNDPMASVSCPDDMPQEQMKTEMESAVREAMQYADPGSDSYKLLEDKLKVTKAKFDLNIVVNQFATSLLKHVRVFKNRMESRRYCRPPGSRTKLDRMPRVCFAIDVSGSMPDWAISQVGGALHSVHRKVDGLVLQIDTGILSEEPLQSVLKPFITRNGCGGTSFVPAFQRAEELGYEGLVLFTDTWGDFPKKFDGKCLVVIPQDIYDNKSSWKVPSWCKVAPLISGE